MHDWVIKVFTLTNIKIQCCEWCKRKKSSQWCFVIFRFIFLSCSSECWERLTSSWVWAASSVCLWPVSLFSMFSILHDSASLPIYRLPHLQPFKSFNEQKIDRSGNRRLWNLLSLLCSLPSDSVEENKWEWEEDQVWEKIASARSLLLPLGESLVQWAAIQLSRPHFIPTFLGAGLWPAQPEAPREKVVENYPAAAAGRRSGIHTAGQLLLISSASMQELSQFADSESKGTSMLVSLYNNT